MIVSTTNPCRDCGSTDTKSVSLGVKKWRTGCSNCFKHTNFFATAAESREEWNLYNPAKEDRLALVTRRLDACCEFLLELSNSNRVSPDIRNKAFDLLTDNRLNEG